MSIKIREAPDHTVSSSPSSATPNLLMPARQANRAEASNSLGSGEETAVNSINNGLSADLPASKETPVQTLDSSFPA